MKILFISNLWPDASFPNRGSDNAVVLRYLSQAAQIRVLSPRPMINVLGRPELKPCPEHADFDPRFCPVLYIPKVGSRFNHRLMARGLKSALQDVRRQFAFDVVLVSWIYPDACATAHLAETLSFPFVAIAQGSDVHQYLKIPARRKIIQSSLERCSGVITRSGELARLLGEAGVPSSKLKTVYNGIDFKIFHSANRPAARQKTQLPAETMVLLFVGNFLPIKNPLLLVRAHAELCRRMNRPVHLVMVGSGPLEADIRREADASGFGKQVFLPGRKRPEEVAEYMRASDLLCLTSHNEGLPNVVLEAFACGLPVLSTRVGGIHEVLRETFLGGFVERAEVPALADAIQARLQLKTDPQKITQFAAQFSWESAAADYLDMLRSAVRG